MMVNGVYMAEREVFARRIEEIDEELVHLSAICKVNLLEGDKVERVIRNDASVCHASNPKAFTKLRELVMLHYAVHTRAAEVIGQAGAQAMIDETLNQIRERLEKLGVIH
jgi:uncharacterized membrane protein